MEPATNTPAREDAAFRANSTARLLTSADRSAYFDSFIRMDVPPKVQVRMMSEPASTKAVSSLRMISGWSITRSSGTNLPFNPIICRLVPVAPSATRISPSFNRSRNWFIFYLP